MKNDAECRCGNNDAGLAAVLARPAGGALFAMRTCTAKTGRVQAKAARRSTGAALACTARACMFAQSY